ncbi:MAG: adenosylcobinamide-GDP ribazoletransferase [Candidatus Sericytochromatia bacterium]|nr:adenosylcobinamide-GDP ribazoletransferase [Candidatus Sericytochromatia bacterium]
MRFRRKPPGTRPSPNRPDVPEDFRDALAPLLGAPGAGEQAWGLAPDGTPVPLDGATSAGPAAAGAVAKGIGGGLPTPEMPALPTGGNGAPFTNPFPLSQPGPLPELPQPWTLARTVREFLLAVQFFTRIPITGRLAEWVGFSPAMLRASAVHFPAVGLIIGGAAAVVHLAAMLGMPAGPMRPLLAAVLGTLVTVWLTGAFHEDGMADTADGLGGSHERERALDIMKDSRIGTYGAVALWLTLSTKVLALASLGGDSLGTMLTAGFAAHGVSRLLPLGLVATMRHVGDTATSKAKPLADAITPEGLVIAGLWTLPAILPLSWFAGSTVLAAALLASFLAAYQVWRMCRRRLGGYTGDNLGATQQATEVAFLLGTAFALGQGL